MGANHVNATWTIAHDEALVAMLATGLSRSEIAGKLNEQFDTVFTRCAVGGRAHRLKLATPEKPKQERKKRVYKYVPRFPQPKPVDIMRIECAEIVPRGLTLLELGPSDCRYPSGDGRGYPGYLFCGHEQVEGSPYCLSHLALSRRS